MSESLIRPLSYEQSLEYQRVTSFQECLGELAVRSITDTIDVEVALPTGDASQEFLDTDYEFESAFYARPSIKPYIEEGISHFEPFITRGGKASRHGVFFGALVTQEGSEIQVAVKPHARTGNQYTQKREADQSCLRDYFSNIAAKACGFESLEPVGVVLNSEGDAYSITELDHDLSSLESFGWSHFYRSNGEGVDKSEIWRKVALLTGVLHDTGSSMHGDLAARNIATNVYGQVFFIDWEDGNVTKCEPRDIEERFGNSYVDLRKLVDSMATPTSAPNPGIGIFQGTDTNWGDAFNDLYFADYAQTRRDLANMGSHHMKKAHDTEEELIQLEVSLRRHIESIQNFYQR